MQTVWLLKTEGKKHSRDFNTHSSKILYLWTSEHADVIMADPAEIKDTRNVIFLKCRHKARFKLERISEGQ